MNALGRGALVLGHRCISGDVPTPRPRRTEPADAETSQEEQTQGRVSSHVVMLTPSIMLTHALSLKEIIPEQFTVKA